MRQFAVEEIERAIRSYADENNSQALQKIVHTRLQIAGLQRADILAILKDLQNHLPEVEEEFIWLNFLQDLWESDVFEARLIGLHLLFATPDLVDAHLWGMLDHWTSGVDNWVLADWLGHVRAIAIHKTPSLVMRMAPWLQSVDPWRRRSAIVSLVYIDPKTLERKFLLEPQEIFAFIEPIIEERHEAVQKAMTWLLKMVAANHPDELSAFVWQHQSRLPQSIVSLVKTRPRVPVQER